MLSQLRSWSLSICTKALGLIIGVVGLGNSSSTPGVVHGTILQEVLSSTYQAKTSGSPTIALYMVILPAVMALYRSSSGVFNYSSAIVDVTVISICIATTGMPLSIATLNHIDATSTWLAL